MTEDYLKSNGWYQWYHKDYWCHRRMVSKGYDETKSGMSFIEACKKQKEWEQKK